MLIWAAITAKEQKERVSDEHGVPCNQDPLLCPDYSPDTRRAARLWTDPGRIQARRDIEGELL